MFKQARPSKKVREAAKRKKLPFSPSVQHAKNTDIMLQCEDCDKWRLVFSKKKLKGDQKRQLNQLLDDIEYTCGVLFGEFYLYPA